MRTVIVTCDQCLTIINKTDVLTGIKYVPTYVKYETNFGGIKREFCGMTCMEQLIHAGQAPELKAPALKDFPMEETAHLPPGMTAAPMVDTV